VSSTRQVGGQNSTPIPPLQGSIFHAG